MKKIKLMKFLCIIAFTIIMQTATAKIWYVGTWQAKPTEDVKNSLSEAYTEASANDQIWIASGKYITPSITLNKSNIFVYGGFAGTENSIEERAKTPGGKPWEFVNPTVLTNSGAQIFNGSGSNSIVVDGITFDGEKESNSSYSRAINIASGNTSTSVVISNCIVKNYRMNGDGAGLNIRCKAEIFDCLITNNENTGNTGGGAYIDYAVTMYRCEITNNKSGSNGAGVSANGTGGTLNVYNCVIKNNVAVNQGGGVYANRCQMHDCIIVNNEAKRGSGIAIDTRNASNIWNVTVADNRATEAGGGGVSFYENSAANTQNPSLQLINSILWNNKDVNDDVQNVANSNTSATNKTNGKILNCIIDRSDYANLSFSGNVIATDSAAIFGENWVTRETSPGVDAGTLDSDVAMPKKDIAGATRIVGKSIDIGPYENQNGDPYVNPNKETFDGIMEVIRNEKESFININSLAATVNGYVYNLSGVCNVADGGNGFFPDINYSDTQGNAYNWKATQHLDRLINMAYVYTVQGSPKQGDNALFTAIEAGARAWIKSHPAACSNWWYNQIAEPQRLGTLLIQMRKGAQQLDEDATEAPILSRMLNQSLSGYPGTGNATSSSNITNVAEHCIYSALLSYNDKRLSTMFNDFIYPAVKISTGITADGIKPDQSHIMHSRVLYIGGYGEELIKNVTYFSVFTAGTKYAMPAEKVAILGNFVRNTWQKTIRGRYMLGDVTGRGISRIGELDKLGSAVYPKRMKAIDPEHADDYDAAIKRIRGEVPASYAIEPLSRQHFIADHTLHIRPGFTFDINFVSTRTQRIEWGNGENKKALYMSDGLTNIVRRGDEYATIHGTWNWARVPGITCLQTPAQATINEGSTTSVQGTSTFAGGVTDSLYSVTAYYYPNGRVNLSAKKGWFMFDNEIVCLGNSITAAGGYDAFDANTTLNQCNLNGDVVVSEDGNNFATLATMDEHAYASSPKWVLHDSIGYVFPNGGNVVVSNQKQSGNWYDINNNGKNAEVSRDVFSLWFNHGKKVSNGSYAYIIVPNKNAAGMKNYYESGDVEILANDASIQAVYHKTLDMLGIIFYSPAAFTGKDISVEVDKPCVLLFKKKADHIEMNIADPAQSQTVINVKTRIPSSAAEWTTTPCDFTNTGDYRGASKAFRIDSSLTGIKEIDADDPVISARYYDLAGKEIIKPSKKGVYIIQKMHRSGKKTANKAIR